MTKLIPNASPVREENACHNPEGPGGGQFCKGSHAWGADSTNRRDLVQCATCGKRAKRWRVEAANKAAVNRRVFKAIRTRER